ncbi:hypothetical protein ABZV25_13750, partial [Micrococcus luteus]
VDDQASVAPSVINGNYSSEGSTVAKPVLSGRLRLVLHLLLNGRAGHQLGNRRGGRGADFFVPKQLG